MSPKGKFLKGKMAWVEWDVEELEKIDLEGSRLTFGLIGWP